MTIQQQHSCYLFFQILNFLHQVLGLLQFVQDLHQEHYENDKISESPTDQKRSSPGNSHGIDLIKTGDPSNARGSDKDICPEIAMAAVDGKHAVI